MPPASRTKPTSNSAGNRLAALSLIKSLTNNSAGQGPRHDQFEIAQPRSAEAPLSAATLSTTAAAAAGTGTRNRTRLHRQEAFALHLLARELAGPADRFRLFPCFLFRWLFVMAAQFHLAENALALHLLL